MTPDSGKDSDVNLYKLYGDFYNPQRLASAFDVPDARTNFNLTSALLRILLLRQRDSENINVNSAENMINELRALNDEQAKELVTIISSDGKKFGKNESVLNYNKIIKTTPTGDGSTKKRSIITINTPYVSPANIDSEYVSMLLNGMPSIVLARCRPILDIEFEFERPELKKEGNSVQLATPSIMKFLLGGDTVRSTSIADYGQALYGEDVRKEPIDAFDKTEETLYYRRAGMELFTSPQTLVNPSLNQNVGTKDSPLFVGVRDPFRPFMSIQNFAINVVPTFGMMTFKTANLNLKLHDRTRLGEISDMIKAETMSRLKLWVRYGLQHPTESGNEYSEFINRHMIVAEAYGVQNSSIRFDDDGGATVSLSLYTLGVNDMMQITITHAEIGVEEKLARLVRAAKRALHVYSARPSERKPTKDPRPIQWLSDISTGKFPRLETSDRKNLARQINSLLAEGEVTLSKEASDKLKEALNEFENNKGDLQKTNYKAAIQKNITNKLNQMVGTDDDYYLEQYNKKAKNITIKEDVKKLAANALNETQLNEIKFAATNGYISFARLFGSFFLDAVKEIPSYDEIQVFFYSFNRGAGPVKNMNIGWFPIEVQSFSDAYTELIHSSKRDVATITIEEFISLVISSQINNVASVAYGLKKFYKRIDDSKKDSDKKNYMTTLDTAGAALRDVFGEFYRPAVEVYVEVVPAAEGSLKPSPPPPVGGAAEAFNSVRRRKTITRIHVYDKVADPFPLPSRLLTGEQSSHFYALEDEALDAANRAKTPEEQNAVIETVGNAVVSARQYDMESIKNYVSRTMPYIRFGSNASGIISADVSSQSDPLLASTQMLNKSNRLNASEPNNSDRGGIPMRIIPVQLSLGTIGCPLLRCAQMFFIDFQTGTSVDNTYIITQLTHTIEPGKFTSSAQATPIDAYGRFYNANEYTTVLRKIIDIADKKRSNPPGLKGKQGR